MTSIGDPRSWPPAAAADRHAGALHHRAKQSLAAQTQAEAEQHDEKISDPSGYDRLIGKAVANQNYRLAIRYLYLQTLQILSNHGLIQLSPDKTNYEYVRELSGKLYQDDFSGITLGYEYVWYGKFEIGKDTYQKLSADYKTFQQKF